MRFSIHNVLISSIIILIVLLSFLVILIPFSGIVHSQQIVNVTKTAVIYSTTTINPGLSDPKNAGDAMTNQMSEFLIILLPSLIIIALMIYIPFKMGVRDEKVYVLLFMFAVSGLGFLSAVGAFGQNGIPWYIAVFVDIIGLVILFGSRQ